MAIPNKVARDTSPFRIAEYPKSIPADELRQWWFDFRTVLLRERELLLKNITAADATDDLLAYEAATNARLTALESSLTALQTQVTNLSSVVSALTTSLAAHIAATVAHGSDGNVVGLNDLLGITNTHGFQTLTVNSSGVTSISYGSGIRYEILAMTMEAGASAYSYTLNLMDTNRTVGDTLHLKLALPASTNPAIVVTDVASGSDIVSFTHDGTAGFLNITFVFNSDLNWYVHSLGTLEAL